MLTYGSLFSGIGGMDLGFDRAGMVCKWQVEIDDYARRVLAKHWPNVRRHDDVRTFPPKCEQCVSFFEEFRCNSPDECDCPECQGLCRCREDFDVDVICGGFPCQDISFAGRGAGLAGKRSGLWFEYARIIRVLRPRFVVVENVAGLLVRGFDAVLGTLADLGYDAEWSMFPACALGAPHTRERMFIVAYSHEIGWGCAGFRHERPNEMESRLDTWKASPRGEWGNVERWIKQAVETGGGVIPAPERGGMADGIPNRLERIGGCGNAIVPAVAEFIARRIQQTDGRR